MPKIKSTEQAMIKAGIESILDQYNLDDIDACDNASELIALQMFTLHCCKKNIHYNEFDKQRFEAFSFVNAIHRRLIDFIDTMEEEEKK